MDSNLDARFTLSQSAVNSIFFQMLHIFQTTTSHLFIHILTLIVNQYFSLNMLLSPSIHFCCSKADLQARYACFVSFQKAHHKAITASHSYLFMNHLFSIIISETCFRYSLRNHTSSSGCICSDIVVNHAISEKNMVFSFFCPHNLTFS